MNILLTNDDGYNADGIMLLYRYFTKKGHSVRMAAPDGQRSAYSQKITVGETVSVKHIKEEIYAMSGTPTDCVLYSLRDIGGFKPDLVVSGVNDGANVGIDLIYSGTAAAARQGAIIGVPSIALSYKWRDDGSPMNESIIEEFLDKYFDRMCELAQDTSTFVNVNFPIPLGDDFPPIKTTFVSKGMTYEDKIVSFDAPNKKRYLWIDNPQDTAIMYASLEHGSDAYELLVQHNITISLVEIYPKGKEFTL